MFFLLCKTLHSKMDTIASEIKLEISKMFIQVWLQIGTLGRE